MRSPLPVAVAQPTCTPGELAHNALEHARLVREARARVVVFPELSLTGYELDAPPVSLSDESLGVVVLACRETNSIAFVGAPVADVGGSVSIAVLRVGGQGVEVVYRKSYLGADEVARFSPGRGPVALDIDGWRVGLGVCKDTGVDQHVLDVADLGVDLYLAGLVHHREELLEQELRAVDIARTCVAYVGFASFAGATGGGFDQTAGMSSIWDPQGTPLIRAGSLPGEVVRAILV